MSEKDRNSGIPGSRPDTLAAFSRPSPCLPLSKGHLRGLRAQARPGWKESCRGGHPDSGRRGVSQDPYNFPGSPDCPQPHRTQALPTFLLPYLPNRTTGSPRKSCWTPPPRGPASSGAPHLSHIGPPPRAPMCCLSHTGPRPTVPPSPAPAACSHVHSWCARSPRCGWHLVRASGDAFVDPGQVAPCSEPPLPDVLRAPVTSACPVSLQPQTPASSNHPRSPTHRLGFPVSGFWGFHCAARNPLSCVCRPSRKLRAGSAAAFLCSHSRQLGRPGVTEHLCPCARRLRPRLCSCWSDTQEIPAGRVRVHGPPGPPEHHSV